MYVHFYTHSVVVLSYVCFSNVVYNLILICICCFLLLCVFVLLFACAAAVGALLFLAVFCALLTASSFLVVCCCAKLLNYAVPLCMVLIGICDVAMCAHRRL